MKRLLKLKAKTKINIKYYTRLIGGYFIFFAIILTIGLLLEKILETLFIIGGYFATRFVMPKIKHFNTTVKCISATSLTFLFAIALLCIPKNTSIVWSIGIGAIIPLIMYAESLLFDKKKYEYAFLEGFYENAIKPKPFNVDTCTESELLARCKNHNYNELKTQMAIKFFIGKEKPKDVWLWLCETQNNPMDWDSVKKTKYRMKKELFESEK